MVPSISLEKLVDKVYGPRDLDLFTCAIIGSESGVDRELIAVSAAVFVVGGGLACEGLASSTSVNSPPTSANANISATTFPRLGMTIISIPFSRAFQ
jgi:hypothetical protein